MIDIIGWVLFGYFIFMVNLTLGAILGSIFEKAGYFKNIEVTAGFKVMFAFFWSIIVWRYVK